MNNLYFVDFENLQDLAYDEIDPSTDMVVIFVGHTQTKISFDIVKKTQRLGKAVEWIQMGGSGRNALDFHIAYYLGYFIASKESTSAECKIYIASGDSDYDVLIKHILSQGHYCERIKSLSPMKTFDLGQQIQHPTNLVLNDAPAPAPAPAKILTNADIFVHLIENLGKVEKLKRPRTDKTLVNHIKAQYLKKKPDLKFEDIFNLLKKNKKITVNQNRISYQF